MRRGLAWSSRRATRFPTHLIVRNSLEPVTTRSPAFRVSTATSPRGVRIRVPSTKQGIGVTSLLLKILNWSLPIEIWADDKDVGIWPFHVSEIESPAASLPVNR